MAQITIEDLKSFLWSAAEDLRGQIDAAGYKEYIFPLLFFKRISDVYDEQYAQFVAEGGEDYAQMQAEELPIRIPDGQHWKDVREVTENVGQRLVEAFISIEQANPAREADGRLVGGLEGIFGPKDGWTNKNKMPDYIITSIIENFSRYNLSLSNCPADEMGQAYEYLVGKFADDAGNTAQEFYTNRTVVELMAEILQPQPDESIYDPTCGSGGMLVKSLDYLRNKGKEWQGVKVFGQEINGLTSSIARMNLYLNGVEDFSIACGDTLHQPAFIDGSKLRRFNVVLANPPYSIKEWNRAAFEHDKWGRNTYGTPPQARADYAFIQHIIASMDEQNGRCAVLLPHGVLNRGEEKEMRINHVKADNIDAVIGLGRNLFYNSGLESFVLLCNSNKPAERKGHVLFIEAEKLTHKEGKQSYLFADDIATIVSAYHNPGDIPGLSKHVSNEEILDNDGNLNIKLYVKSLAADNDASNPIEALNQSSKKLAENISSFSLYDGLPFEFVPTQEIEDLDKSNWKLTRLGDIAEEYSVRIDNPSESEYEYYIGSDCIGQYDFRIGKKSPSSGVTSAQKLFKKGDYLLVRRSLYGSDFRERAPRADFDGVCSADILTIREKEGKVADGFLIWILYQRSLWDYIVSNSSGGLTRRIKWKQLENFEILLPSLDEQKVLADKLWAAYRVKESYRKLLAATDDMVKAKFVEMFDFKGNPQNWPVMNFEQFATFDCNMTTEFEKYANYPHIGIDSIERETGILSGYHTVAEDHVISGKYIFTPEHIIYSKIRPYLNKVAIPDFDGLCSADSYPILPKNEFVARKFLAYIMRSKFFLDFIIPYSVRTGMPKVNKDQISEFRCPMPPLNMQLYFLHVEEQAEATKASLRQSIESIDRVIKSLINQ